VSNPPNVAGNAPLAFTTSLGEQLSVPLSAFSLSGSTITFSDAWANQFLAADQAILLALAKNRLATGDLAAAPAAPPVPALSFTAAAAGPTGNNITVTIGSVTGTSAVDGKLTLDVAETDTFSALASASAAALAIGTDVAPASPTDPPLGTGVVVVKSGSATGTGLPKTGQSWPVTAEKDVLAADGTTTLFVLQPRAGAPAAGINTVTVDVDPGGTTFTVTAQYDSGASAPIAVTELPVLTDLPAAVTFLVHPSAPPAGLALPAAGGVTLSGGATGLPATATAYTS